MENKKDYYEITQLENLNRKLKRIRIKKMPNTFLSIINKKFDEVTISRCLAFLLNPQNTTIKIIKELLDVSKIPEDEENFGELLDNESTYFENIELEEAISERSRIDIMIEFSTFVIVIENKINSMENNIQSVKYEKDLEGNIKPIKYICIKPKYNATIMKNKKFAHVTYSQIVEILKTVTKYELKEQENYCFIEDFIKHVEGYLMNETQLEITEDVEVYIDNQEVIDTMISNYKKSEIIAEKLEEIVKRKFGEKFEVYNNNKWKCIQIWKKSWINEQYSGIHYEILWDENGIIGNNVKIIFAIHNEGKTRNIFPEIKHRTVKTESYRMNDSKSIIENLNKIVEEMYKIAEENNEAIDKVIGSRK